MNRFGRLVIGLWLTVSVLIVGVMLYGHAHSGPNRLQVLGYEFCEGQPCFMGITPGLTSIDSAMTIMAQRGAIQSRADTTYSNFLSATRIDINYDDQTNLVSTVGLLNAKPPISIGDVIEYLGQPCAFSIGLTAQQLGILYPRATVIIDADFQQLNLGRPRLEPATPIKNIVINSGDTADQCSTYLSWPGFTSLKRYLDLYFLG